MKNTQPNKVFSWVHTGGAFVT